MSKKKLRLKREFRIVLHRVKMVGVSCCISTAVTPLITSQVVPVHAETLNENFALKTTAALQHKDLSNASTLKEYAVIDYNTKNDTQISKNDAKVVMKAPAVVTAPTIETVTFEVSDSTQPVEETSDNAEKSTETEKKTETSVEKESEETKTDSVQTAETVSAPVETAAPAASEAPVSQKADTSEEDNTSEKSETKKTDEKAEASSEKEEATGKQFEAAAQSTAASILPESVVITPLSDTESIDLDEVPAHEETDANQSSVAAPKIELYTSQVTITDGSEFVPEDYLKTVSGSNGNLPMMKIDNPVDRYRDGEYTVTYTATDLNGLSTEAVLKVTIDNSEIALQRRAEAKQKSIDEFVAETSGKHIDVDGYYGDQCWDLWGYFNKTKNLTDFDFSCSPYGYVYAIPNKYKKSGASYYYKYIEPGESLQAGDWLFWDKGSSYADSHVALLLGVNGDGTLKCLTQSKDQGTRVLDLQSDIMAAFRLKDAFQWWNYTTISE